MSMPKVAIKRLEIFYKSKLFYNLILINKLLIKEKVTYKGTNIAGQRKKFFFGGKNEHRFV